MMAVDDEIDRRAGELHRSVAGDSLPMPLAVFVSDRKVQARLISQVETRPIENETSRAGSGAQPRKLVKTSSKPASSAKPTEPAATKRRNSTGIFFSSAPAIVSLHVSREGFSPAMVKLLATPLGCASKALKRGLQNWVLCVQLILLRHAKAAGR